MKLLYIFVALFFLILGSVIIGLNVVEYVPSKYSSYISLINFDKTGDITVGVVVLLLTMSIIALFTNEQSLLSKTLKKLLSSESENRGLQDKLDDANEEVDYLRSDENRIKEVVTKLENASKGVEKNSLRIDSIEQNGKNIFDKSEELDQILSHVLGRVTTLSKQIDNQPEAVIQAMNASENYKKFAEIDIIVMKMKEVLDDVGLDINDDSLVTFLIEHKEENTSVFHLISWVVGFILSESDDDDINDLGLELQKASEGLIPNLNLKGEDKKLLDE